MNKTTATSNPQQKLGWRGLGATMSIQMLLVALVPLIVVAAVVIVSLSVSIANMEEGFLAAREEMAKELGQGLQGSAEGTIDAITTYVTERIHDTNTWAASPLLRQAARDAAVQAEELGLTEMTVDDIEIKMDQTKALSNDLGIVAYLNDITEREPAFTEIFFTEAHGYNVAHSSMTSDFVQAGEEWWETAWAEGSSLGQVEYDDSAGVYAMEMSVRIDDTDGTPLGVLKAVIDVSAFQELVTKEAGHIEDSSVRLFTREGDQIADSSSGHDPQLIMTEKGNLLHRGWQIAEQILRGDSKLGHLTAQQDLDGQPIVLGYASIGAHDAHDDGDAHDDADAHDTQGILERHDHGLEELGWMVTIAQPEDIALSVLTGLDEQVVELRTVRSTVIVLLAIVGGIAAVAAVVAAVLASRSIAQPIARLAGVSQRLAGGDFDAEITVDQRNEIGQLQDAFARMAGQLREILESERNQREHLEQTVAEYMEFVGNIAAGNLTTRLSTNGSNGSEDPLTVLGHNLNNMVDNLRDMTVRTKEAATALSSQSAEILATTTQQASGATEQSAAISQATTTVDEIKTIAEQSVSRSQTVADMAQRTVEVSRAGQELVQETVSGMSQIKTRVDVIEENILALSERTNQIGEIIDTVNQIASQSNMLALNAAVEAARAGEQGKGFAVVAEEVRDLAERSTQATAQVKAILSDIQKATNATGMATEEGKKGVDAGVQLVGQMGQALSQLAQVIAESAQSAVQMVAGGRQQTSGMEQIALAMQNINQVTVQSMASTRQAEKSAQELNGLAVSLTETVEQYRL